jgi:hypothetical protein
VGTGRVPDRPRIRAPQGRAADRLGHPEHGERQARGERELRQRIVGQPHEQVHDHGGAERVQDQVARPDRG